MAVRMAGDQNTTFRQFTCRENSIQLCTDGFPVALLENLPLSGHQHRALTNQTIDRIEQAIDALASEQEWRSELFFSWTSLIVFLQKNPSFEEISLLTSSTLPEFPYCTFITQKAFHHIPPNNIFERFSPYALKENLFHEALHHKLSARILHNDILTQDYDARTTAKIPVPWRGGAWEPDRVLHAVYVYSNLLPLRMEHAAQASSDHEECRWVRDSIMEGRQALLYLCDQLSNRIDIFTDLGLELYAEVQENSLVTLEKLETV